MRILGAWEVGDDGLSRPVVKCRVYRRDNSYVIDDFLVDSGADRTVLSAGLLEKLEAAGSLRLGDLPLVGIGGVSASVLVSTFLEFVRDDDNTIRIHGMFTAFTDPAASDLSILGRDVLNNFDVVISWTRKELLLLAGHHAYVVTET